MVACALESGELQIPNFQAQATDQPSGSGSLDIGGGSPGVNAVLKTKVADAYTIIVLSNLDPPSASAVAEQIRTWLGTGQN
jgi:hypothetical protein